MPELLEWDTGASQSLETPCDFPDLPTLGEGDNSSPSLEIDDHSSAHDCHGSDTDELTLAVARGTDLPTLPASGCGIWGFAKWAVQRLLAVNLFHRIANRLSKWASYFGSL